MPGDFPIRDWYDFQETLRHRLWDVFDFPPNSSADRDHHFVMPCGLFLVIDEENGGDITAQELVKRFYLLDQESRAIIDFYFLGWKWTWGWSGSGSLRRDGISFDLRAFDRCRQSLRAAGIDCFGGNADLVLVDAHYKFTQLAGYGGITNLSIKLDFQNAIHVNLSSRRQADEIPPLGEFLQSIVVAAADVRKTMAGSYENGAVAHISDRLGLAIAGSSLLQFIYEKWGTIIGAKRLDAIAVRNLGPMLPIETLQLTALPVADR